MIRALAGASGLALLAGCATPGAMLAPAPAGLAPAPPAAAASDVAVIVYSHGSRQEFRRDPCEPRGATTPPVMRALAGARAGGLRLAIYADCQPTRRGDFVASQRRGTPKVEQRAAELEALVHSWARMGIPPRRIVFAGHSAGAWASLWAARDGTPPVAAVVAFAPAFAGPANSRSAGWQWLRDTHVRALGQARHMPALVFAFAGDPFEDPEDLAFLSDIPGTTLERVAGGPCPGRDPHRTVFRECFAERYREQILSFLDRTLRQAADRERTGVALKPR